MGGRKRKVLKIKFYTELVDVEGARVGDTEGEEGKTTLRIQQKSGTKG